MAANSKHYATTASIQAVVVQKLAGQGGANPTVQVYVADTSGNSLGTWTGGNYGDMIAVEVDLTYAAMIIWAMMLRWTSFEPA